MVGMSLSHYPKRKSIAFFSQSSSGIFFELHLFVADNNHTLFISDSILKYIFIKIWEPFISSSGLNFEGRVDDSLKFDSLAIDPRIGIVELKHVNAFFNGVYAIFYDS